MKIMTILESRLLEFKRDLGSTRYLMMVLLETEDKDTCVKERSWESISGPKFIEESEIYKEAVSWAQRAILKKVDCIYPANKYGTLNMFGEYVSVARKFKTYLEVAMYVMQGVESVEPYDRYAAFGYTLMVDYKNSKGNPTGKRATSSTALEDIFTKQAKNLLSVRFSHTYMNGFQLYKKGRLFINRDNYFLIKMDGGYFFGLSKEELATPHKCRAARFLSEDEALDYAMTYLDGQSFEVKEEHERNALLERYLQVEKDNFLLCKDKLEETLPIPKRSLK